MNGLFFRLEKSNLNIGEKMRYSALAVVLAGYFMTDSAAGAALQLEPVVFAVKADADMTVDGKDTEPCYSKARPTEDFRTCTGDKITPTSRVRAAYDDKKFYFFYDCDELEQAEAPRPSDSVELFLGKHAPNHEGLYYQIYAELGGNIIFNKGRKIVKDPELLGKFEIKFRRKGKGFCCEIAVCRDLFPQKNDVLWRVNFNRSRPRNDAPRSSTCWSPTGTDFHTPARFGYLFLGERADFVQLFYGKAVRLQMKRLRELAAKFPAMKASAEYKKLNGDCRKFIASLKGDPSAEEGKRLLGDIRRYQTRMMLGQIRDLIGEFGETVSPEGLEELFADRQKESFEQKRQRNIRENRIYRVNKPGSGYLDPCIPADFYDRIVQGKFTRNVYPVFSDRKAWEKARKSKYADWIISQADAVAAEQVPPLLFSNYRKYITEGDRAGYENLYFGRRKNMAALALALCLTGDKEKYMPRLLDYVVAILEESTWCAPAHAQWDKAAQRLLDSPETDIFASETGAVMALLHHILGEELDKYSENLSDRIRKLTLERTVYSVLYHPEASNSNWWYRTERPTNWSAWCAYSNLMVSVLLEKDTKRMAEYIREFMRVNAHYISAYDKDGYCSEGPGYYTKSGLNLFTALHFLNKVVPGSMEKVFAHSKVRGIFEYIAHVGIGKDSVVNYGDNGPHANNDIRIAICGETINSEIMKNLYADMEYSLKFSGEYLDSGLKLLFDVPEKRGKKSAIIPFSCYKDRLAILRTAGFSAAVKAGSNAEEHNHNDLGHVTVYYKGEPVIVDPGHERYKAINFSDARYTLWYTRGMGHNAPFFGTVEQLNGHWYTADFKRTDPEYVAIDLSKAYPKAAGVKSFIREVDFSADEVVLKDKFELSSPKPAGLRFVTPCSVKKISKDTLLVGEVLMTFPGLELRGLEQKIIKRYWGKPLTVIELKTDKSDYKITFRPQKAK